MGFMHMYVYTYMLSASWKLPGRFFMVSVVDITQRFRMVSVVVVFLCFMASVDAGNVLFMVSVVGCFMVSVAVGNMFYGFRRGAFFLFYGFRRGMFLWCPSRMEPFVYVFV